MYNDHFISEELGCCSILIKSHITHVLLWMHVIIMIGSMRLADNTSNVLFL